MIWAELSRAGGGEPALPVALDLDALEDLAW